MTSNYSSYGHPKGRVDENGNWVRSPDAPVSGLNASLALKLAIAYTTLDGATLYTVPTDMRLLVEQMFWEVATAFTGGTASAIGVSSDQAPHSTQGDLLGGAGGDVEATLVAGLTQGTLGASFSSAPNLVVLEPGAIVRFDRIVDAFTAGAGFVHLIGRPLAVS